MVHINQVLRDLGTNGDHADEPDQRIDGVTALGLFALLVFLALALLVAFGR